MHGHKEVTFMHGHREVTHAWAHLEVINHAPATRLLEDA